jgi:uncharacterized membrane protein YdfJ with MMPL/SSD domain
MRESIATSVSSSGTAIVFAGGTVVIALASLAVAGIPLVTMLGIASAIAVALAVLTSLTLLPAILSLVGGGVNRLRIPSFLKLPPRPEGRRRWEVWARWVTSHPWTAIGLSALILLPLLLPLLSLELGQPDVGVAPTSTTQRKAYDLTTHGFGVGANGPLLIAMSLDPVATPSQEYTSKDNEALALQKELEATQKSLEKQQASLKQQQKQLEAQQKTLEAQGASLKRQQASLERQAATLQAEQDQVKREAERIAAQARKLARKILPLEAHLHALEARERLLERRIAHTTDPNTLARLRARLARVRARERTVRAELAPLLQKARALEAQARALAARERQLVAQAADLQRQKQVLEAQASHLEDQKRTLERQATTLRRQADDLQRQADAAKKKKQHALDLKQQLTVMLTKAGGNPLGTDPRIVAVQDAVTATSDVAEISPPLINDDGSAAVMNAVPAKAPSSDQTAELVTVLRVQTLPAATGSNGVQAHVGGTTATYVDLARTIAARMPIVILTVLALSFVFLMVVFRSLLVPVQACVTNLLCVGAALGVLTAVFQWGWGLSGIGLHAPEGTVPIASYVPLMMFAVLFGLSMDYEVFTVSRIQQRAAAGADPRTAVTTGVGGAARVVTSAALIMFFVFASFVLNGDPTIKQFGIGLATAVFLAGTMSVLLVPAMLTLFGRRLFWLPAWLGRILPHLDVEGGGDVGQPVVAGGEMGSASP